MSLFTTKAFRTVAAKWTPRAGYQPPFPTYHAENRDLNDHLRSHSDQAINLISRGLIANTLAPIVHVFIGLHDYGYSNGGAGLLSLDYYQANSDQYFRVYRQLAQNRTDAESVSRQMYDYVHGCLLITDPTRLHIKHMGGRVVGHAVNSIPYICAELTEAGASYEQAFAFGRLVASHHLAYPLDPLVTGFAAFLGIPIPEPLRPIFMVGGSTVTGLEGNEKEAEAQRRGDMLRAEIADAVAPVLGISAEEARFIAVLTYALDRITPSRRMQSLVLRDDGSFDWSGGETAKRYGLVVGNISTYIKQEKMRPDQAHFRTVYSESIVQFRKEVNAARVTADNLGISTVRRLINTQSEDEICKTVAVQDAAVQVMEELGIGAFADIEQDINVLSEKYRNHGGDAVGYLLGTMLTCLANVRRMFPTKS